MQDKGYWQAQIDWLRDRFPEGKYRDVIGLCKVATLSEEDGIIDQDYSLNPGRYVGVVFENDETSFDEFKNEMEIIEEDFVKLNLEAKDLEAIISSNLRKFLED